MTPESPHSPPPGILSCSILIVDSYQTEPVLGFDATFSPATKTQLNQVPIVRVFGIDVLNGGRKVCVHIHRVYPYLCVAMGATLPDERRKVAFVESLEKALNEHAKVARHRIVEATFFKGRNFYGYYANEEVFLRISFSHPGTIKRASEVLTSGLVGGQMPVFEAHIPFSLQFMIDHQLQGMNLLRLNKCRYRTATPDWEGGTIPKQTCCEVEVDCDVEDILNQVEQQHMNPGLRAIWQDPRLSDVVQLDATIVERVLVPSERELSYRTLLWKYLGVSVDEQSSDSTAVQVKDKNHDNTDDGHSLTQTASSSQAELQDTLLDAAADLLSGEADSILFSGPHADEHELDHRESIEMSQLISEEILQEVNSTEAPASAGDDAPSTLFSDSETAHTESSTQSFLDNLAAMRETAASEDSQKMPTERRLNRSNSSDSSDVFSDEDTLVHSDDGESMKKDDSLKVKVEPNQTIATSDQVFEDVCCKNELLSDTSGQALCTGNRSSSETYEVRRATDNNADVKVEKQPPSNVGNSELSNRLITGDPNVAYNKYTDSHRKDTRGYNDDNASSVDNETASEQLPTSRWDVLRDLPQEKRSLVVQEALQWLKCKIDTCSEDATTDKAQQVTSQRSSNDTLSQDLQCAYSFGGSPEAAEKHHEMLTSLCCEIHCATRDSLKPDPALDPVLAIVVVLHNDFPGQSEMAHVKVVYDGCVDEKPLRRSLLAHVGAVGSVELIKCSGELSIIMTFAERLARWDPDIILGFETDTLSWGFLIDRCLALQLNPKLLLSRVAVDMSTDELHNTRGQNRPDLPAGVKFDADRERYFESWEYRLTGRVLLNVWRILRKELSLTSYSFENVYFHIMHQREPKVCWRTLRNWYEDELLISRCLAYYVKRCIGCLEMLNRLETYTKTCEMARIYGILFYEVLSRGSQFRVESMMLRSTRKDGFIAFSPTVLDRNLQRSMEWIPLVMEPHSNFYTDPVVVLDFQSLYPSVMIAYNYCFSTCFGKVQDIVKGTSTIKFGCSDIPVDKNELRRLKDDIIISPSGSVFAKHYVRKGILPQLVEEILDTRIMVKKGMKNCSSKSYHRILDARQLGLKLIANVTYGYTAAGYSGRMPLVELADAIVSKGKESLEMAISVVNATSKWNAEVVYGDTDSMFICLRGRDKAEAFRIGREIAEKVSAVFPDPMKLKFEKVYLPSVLETKKRYFGYMYETEEQTEPVLDAKGIELIRRDGCKAQQVVLEKAIKTLFETQSFESVKKVAQRCFEQMLRGRFGLHRYVFAKEYNGASYYQQNSCVPVLKIARLLKASDPRAEPLVGERVPYIVTQGWDKSRIIDLVAHPYSLLEDSRKRPNITYYILRVICPALDRALLKVRTADWYHQLPKHLRVPPSRDSVKKTMVYEYFDVNRCLVCDRTGQCVNRVCELCQSDSQRAVYVSQLKMRNLEDDFRRVYEVCRRCMAIGDPESCRSLDCPIFMRRVHLRHRLVEADQLSLVQYMF